MRKAANSKNGAASFDESKPACQILILHDDFAGYSRAVEICRRVMEQFASELDFDVKCWNFIELADPNCAKHAAKTAGGADIILLSARNSLPPPELGGWLDLFFTGRFKQDGVLALVPNAETGFPPGFKGFVQRLELAAERLGMDFLSMVPETDTDVFGLMPENPDSKVIRA